MTAMSEILRCANCGQPFVISEGEERFLRATFENYLPPKRCRECRRKRKLSGQQQPAQKSGSR